MKKVRIYLAGYSGEKKYRADAKKNFGDRFELLDPFTANPAEGVSEYKGIVEGDKLLIMKCDCVIAYINRASFGTAMEIIYAWQNDIPVFVACINKDYEMDNWIRYHAEGRIYFSVGSAFGAIAEYFLFKNKLKRLKGKVIKWIKRLKFWGKE